MLAHVRAEVADELAALDPHDPETWHALHRLRRECVEAKEALSADTEVTVPVVLPTGRRSVRLGRADFEAHIRDAVAATVEEFLVTLADADVAPHELDHVLLAGGSSTIPLVGRMLTEALGRPVSADADPLTVVALGAAVAARASADEPVDDEPAPVRGPQRPPATVTGLFEDLPETEDVDPPRGRGLRRALVASVVMAAVVAVAVTVPLPLDDAVGESVRGAVRDAFGAPEAALTVPPTAPVPAFAPSPAVAPPTVVARPLSAATPLAPAGGPVPAAAPVVGAPAGTPRRSCLRPARLRRVLRRLPRRGRRPPPRPRSRPPPPPARRRRTRPPSPRPSPPPSRPPSRVTEPTAEPTGSTAPPVEQSAEETPEPADPPAEAQTEDGSGGETAPAEEPAGEPA